MYWRIGAAYRPQPREQNKAAFHEIVKRGPSPGLLAFYGELAVDWAQLTPRADLPHLDRAWRLRRVDELPVWSLSCFYVRIGHRKQGVTSALIAAALKAEARPSPRAGSLSTGRRQNTERFRHPLRHHCLSRRIQDCRLARAAPPHHAAQSQVHYQALATPNAQVTQSSPCGLLTVWKLYKLRSPRSLASTI